MRPPPPGPASPPRAYGTPMSSSDTLICRDVELGVQQLFDLGIGSDSAAVEALVRHWAVRLIGSPLAGRPGRFAMGFGVSRVFQV